MLREIYSGVLNSQYFFPVITFFVFLLVIRIFRLVVLKRFKVWAEKSRTTFDDFLIQIIEKNLFPVLYFGVFYICVKGVPLGIKISKFIDSLWMAVLTIFAVKCLLIILNYALEKYLEKTGKSEAREKSLKGVFNILRVLVIGFAVILFLDNIGIKVSVALAGLGIGGVAVALAAQTILGDLFSYFAILFDRPFEVGDFIIVGEYLGTIEHIGIKTTRVRSLGGEQLIFSNADLTNSRVRNYKRMEKRRVVFKLGVTYQTTSAQVKEIPQIITDIIKNIKDTVFDRAHFSSYGDFSLIYEVVYYVLSSDYNRYMDTQQEINFRIKEEFEKRGIEFAYPTQTLFVNKS